MKNTPKICYVTLPDGEELLRPFKKDIPLPLLSDSASADIPITEENLSNGLLRLLREEPGHTHAEYYRQLVSEFFPDMENTLRKSAHFAIKDGDLDSGEESIMTLLAIAPNTEENLLLLGYFYEEKAELLRLCGSAEEEGEVIGMIESVYNGLLARDLISAKVYKQIGHYHLRMKNFRLASECLTAHLERETSLGAEEKKRCETLIDSLKPLLDERMSHAIHLMKQGRYEEAITDLAAYSESVANPLALHLLGRAYRLNGSPAEGRNFLLAIVESGNENGEVLLDLALCERALGRSDRASSYLHRLLEREPGDVEAAFNLGLICEEEGNYNEARGFYEAARLWKPGYLVAEIRLEKLKEQGGVL